ncbi:MAG: hypothetical protein PWR31_19 [Bacillota bacterium]|nr:hypothetical protein [Bacillota bacterium]
MAQKKISPGWDLIALVALLLVLFIYRSGWRDAVTTKTLAYYLARRGGLAPWVFLGACLVRPFVLIPSSVFALAAGLVFGAWRGFGYAWLGTWLGAFVAYAASNWLAHGLVERLLPRRWQGLLAEFTDIRWQRLLALRFTPVLPFDAVNYAAGLSGVAPGPYLLATAVGIVPGVLLYSYLGSRLRAAPGSGNVAPFILYFLVLAAGFLWAWRGERGQRRH